MSNELIIENGLIVNGSTNIKGSLSSNYIALDYQIDNWEDLKNSSTTVNIVSAVNNTLTIYPSNGPIQGVTISNNITISSISTPNSAQYHLVTLNINYVSGEITWDNSILYGKSFPVGANSNVLSVSGINTVMFEYRWTNSKPIAHLIDNPRDW